MSLRASSPWVAALLVATLRGPATADTPIVFASRDLNIRDALHNAVVRGQNVPEDFRRAAVIERAESGKLVYLDERRSPRDLVDATAPESPEWTPVDVMDPDVSYDAQRVLFSGYSASEEGWMIFEIGVDGTGLRQLTRTDR